MIHDLATVDGLTIRELPVIGLDLAAGIFRRFDVRWAPGQPHPVTLRSTRHNPPFATAPMRLECSCPPSSACRYRRAVLLYLKHLDGSTGPEAA